MYQYEKTQRYFAQIAGGTEALGVQELIALGAEEAQPAFRGVRFRASNEALYRICYESRLVTRILAPILSFDCHSEDYLYKIAHTRIRWADFMTVEDSFALFANVSNSKIRHSQYAFLRLKDALVDQFRNETGERPRVERETPDVFFNLHVENNHAVISLDLGSGSLHRRGYRRQAGDAPMQETVAAAMLYLSQWKGETPLYDPFCGSGTLLAEALMTQTHTPAGYLRGKWGVPYLPNFDAALWQRIRAEADAKIESMTQDWIGGSDRDERMVYVAQDNLALLPSGKQVDIFRADFRSLQGFEDTTILCNPPYGIRMSDPSALAPLYKAFGDWLKQRCKGSTAFVYCGNRDLIPALGLKPAFKKPLINGALDGRLVKLEIF